MPWYTSPRNTNGQEGRPPESRVERGREWIFCTVTYCYRTGAHLRTDFVSNSPTHTGPRIPNSRILAVTCHTGLYRDLVKAGRKPQQRKSLGHGSLSSHGSLVSQTSSQTYKVQSFEIAARLAQVCLIPFCPETPVALMHSAVHAYPQVLPDTNIHGAVYDVAQLDGMVT